MWFNLKWNLFAVRAAKVLGISTGVIIYHIVLSKEKSNLVFVSFD